MTSTREFHRTPSRAVLGGAFLLATAWAHAQPLRSDATSPATPIAEPPAPVEAQPDPPPDKAQDMTAAVLPIAFREQSAFNRELSTVLTTALTTHLGGSGKYQVLSADEVSTLVDVEAHRQGLGALDDGALQEITGALGTRFVVMGEVARSGAGHVWTSSVVERASGIVVQRFSVRAKVAEAFVAQARDMALRLSDRPPELDVSAPDAKRKFGFARDADFNDFVAYREENRQLTASEALTAFIKERNLESSTLAAAEAMAFGAAAGLAALAMFAVTAAVSAVLSLRLPGAGFIGSVAGIGLMAAAMVAGVVGLVLVALDAADRGRVKLRRSGCCRDDDAIRDEESRDDGLRASALVVTLAAPTTIAAGIALTMLTTAVMAGLGLAFSRWLPPFRTLDDPLQLAEITIVGSLLYALVIPTAMPLCVGTPVGLFLLAWPTKSAVPRPARRPPRTVSDEEVAP